MKIINMINGNQSTQTHFERNNCVQVNLNRYKEEYKAKLATGNWRLEHGVVKNFTSWRERQNITMQIQTMSLEANKRYYKENKFDKWFEKEIEMDNQGSSSMLQVRELETEDEREQPIELERLREIDRRRRDDDTGETEAAVSYTHLTLPTNREV